MKSAFFSLRGQRLTNAWVALCLGGLLWLPYLDAALGLGLVLAGGVHAAVNAWRKTAESASGEAPPPQYGPMWIMLLFAAVGIGLDVVHSAHLGAYEMYIPFLWAPLVCAVLVKGRLRAQTFFAAVAAGAVVSGVYAWVQLALLQLPRPQGFMGSPITYGNTGVVFAALSLMGLVWAFQSRRGLLWPSLMVAGFLGGVTTSIISASKGGWASIVFAVLWVAFTAADGLNWRRRLALAGAALGLVAALALSPLSPVPQRLASAWQGLTAYWNTGQPVDGSVGERLELWRYVVTAWTDHPWLGHGKAGLMQHKQALIDQGELSPAIAPFTSMHNEALHHLIEKGLFGFGNWALLMGVLLWHFARHARSPELALRPIAQAGILVIFLYLEFGLSDTIFVLHTNRHLFTFLMAALMALLAQATSAPQAQTGLEPALAAKHRSTQLTLDALR